MSLFLVPNQSSYSPPNLVHPDTGEEIRVPHIMDQIAPSVTNLSASSAHQAYQDQAYSDMTDYNNSIFQGMAKESADSANEAWRNNLDYSVAKQRELRRTAYQDTVESLESAGLNPILAVSDGSVSTPSVSSSAYQASTGGWSTVDSSIAADIYKEYVSATAKVFSEAVTAMSPKTIVRVK